MAAIAVMACGESFVGPDLPTEAVVVGVVLQAELTQTTEDPTTVRVRVVASNPTAETVELEFLGPDCSVRPAVYSTDVNGSVFGPPGTNSCANYAALMTLAPGESRAFPDEPIFNFRERLGASFRPGEYVVGALLEVGSVTENHQMIELRAERVNAR